MMLIGEFLLKSGTHAKARIMTNVKQLLDEWKILFNG